MNSRPEMCESQHGVLSSRLHDSPIACLNTSLKSGFGIPGHGESPAVWASIHEEAAAWRDSQHPAGSRRRQHMRAREAVPVPGHVVSIDVAAPPWPARDWRVRGAAVPRLAVGAPPASGEWGKRRGPAPCPQAGAGPRRHCRVLPGSPFTAVPRERRSGHASCRYPAAPPLGDWVAGAAAAGRHRAREAGMSPAGSPARAREAASLIARPRRDRWCCARPRGRRFCCQQLAALPSCPPGAASRTGTGGVPGGSGYRACQARHGRPVARALSRRRRLRRLTSRAARVPPAFVWM
jgi:hypothetical protein